ncbi:hypothetical protein [Paraliomyxa miuraensis]|uniref:hypothetical protein n=1 Tax=Paraliomyxa miuraensis TaxID=376150 RepID=UPI0022573D92|nr:hypothetical protein [Paraliomyxa miuraensis]MCX4242838.1 hypothetical protein [Paraliomyxa miuraensis]
MARPAPDSSHMPWGVLLALAVGLALGVHACRAGESERCICPEDCKEGLVCVASGRVLQAGECTPAVGEDANPGVCVPEEEAGDGDGGDGYPEVFMDLGSKRDFDPAPPPTPETESGTTDATGGGTTDATGGGTTDATGGTTDATSGTTDATSTSDGGSGTGTSSSTSGT